jgi:hypothetical protein
MQLFKPTYIPEGDPTATSFNRHLDWFVLDGMVPEGVACQIGQTQTDDQLLTFAIFENGQRLVLVESVDA